MGSVYVETTVVGHLAGRLHNDPAVAARQKVTRQWWSSASSQHRLLVSQIVLEECGGGDPAAAQERLEIVEVLEVLEVIDAVRDLAMTLISRGAIPHSEPRDALHISIAAVHGVEYLVTWNFKHIANASLRSRIEAACRAGGCEPPIICTPEELAGGETDV